MAVGLALWPATTGLCLLLLRLASMMPAALPGPSGLSPEEGGCEDELDCSLNGVCDDSGKCICDAAWSGNANCSTLAFLPAKVKNGYGFPGSPVSSWGAGVQQDPATKQWIMAVSDYALSCGQSAFPPNQQCGLAVADSPDGPYTKNRTMIDPYCEGSSISRDPISGRWLYLHGGRGVAGGHSAAHPARTDRCWNCSGSGRGVTPESVQSAFDVQNNATPLVSCPRTAGTYDANATSTADGPEVALVSTTADPLGPWELVPAVACGSNVEPWFTPNGTLYVIAPGGQPQTPSAAKRCNAPGGGGCALGRVSRAESLEAAIAGQWEQLPPQYVLAGTNQSFSSECDLCFNWEDQTLWTDKRGNFHTIAHAYRGQPNDYPVCDRTSSAAAFMNCTALGGHAFSKDGSHWYISPVAVYTPTVHYEDGSVLHLRARERPHVITDPSSGDLTHVISGAADPCPPGINCSAGCRSWNARPWNISGKAVTPPCDPAGCGQNIGCPGADHSFTLVQTLKRS